MKKIFLLLTTLCLTTLTVLAQGVQINGTVDDPSCPGDLDGNISLIVTGGQAPYAYSWSIGQTTKDITGLAAGTYAVTVTDVMSATNSANFTLADPAPLFGVLASVDAISCSGNADGEVTVQAAGGSPPYDYGWPIGVNGNGPMATNLVADNYVVTITDANLCEYELNFYVDEPSPIVITKTQVYECESGTGNNGEVTIFATGGTPPYLYRWSDGANTSNASRNDLPYGAYSITVEDTNNCTSIVTGLNLCHSNMVLPANTILCQFGEIELLTFAPGALAYSWSPTTALSCTDCSAPIASPTITTTYTVNISTPNGTQFEHQVNIVVDENCIWPGDIDSSGTVSHFDLLPIGLKFAATGPTRYLASPAWTGQTALPWPEAIPGTNINLKHVDADGSGLIDEADIAPLNLNWEENLNFTNDISPYPNIPLIDTLPFFVEVDTMQEGETITVPVILGVEDLPGMDIYGIAFSIDYDSSLFVPGTALLTFENSWLGEEGVDMITVQREFSIPGRLDVAMIRTDGQNTGGSGQIASYTITVEDDILFTGHNDQKKLVSADDLEINFAISDVRLLNKDGFQMEPYTPVQTGILTDHATGRKELPVFEDLFQVFPNPVQNKLLIHSNTLPLDHFQLYNAAGVLVNSTKVAGVFQIETDVSQMPNGTYWIRLRSEDQVFTTKVVVLR